MLTKENVVKTDRKVAVVTGASQGIGAGLFRGYLDRGYRIVAECRVKKVAILAT